MTVVGNLVPSAEDALHVQNTKLLTKLLFLVDAGARGIGTIELPNGSFGGILEYESYRAPSVSILKYSVGSEFKGAEQWKVWTKTDKEMVFHASEFVDGVEQLGSAFIWRNERPHGRLVSSNTYWSTGEHRSPIAEPAYLLHTYVRGEPWEQEVTQISKGMLRQGSRLFDCPYRSQRRLDPRPDPVLLRIQERIKQRSKNAA